MCYNGLPVVATVDDLIGFQMSPWYVHPVICYQYKLGMLFNILSTYGLYV